MYYASEKEMETLDALAVRSGLEIGQMMELAGWHMVSLFKKLRMPKSAVITIVVGKGNKGGDGLSAARHIVNNGWKVQVILLSINISKDSKHHLLLIKKMKIPIILYSQNKEKAHDLIKNSDILIDALIGYHLSGSPRGVFKEIIECMNGAKNKIIAYDLPSGVDATTGKCMSPCIRAYATLSLALPKRAFKTNGVKKSCGKIFLADIGIPNFLYDRIRAGSRPHFGYSDGLMRL